MRAKTIADSHQTIAAGDFKLLFLARSAMARRAADAAIGTAKRELIERGVRAGPEGGAGTARLHYLPSRDVRSAVRARNPAGFSRGEALTTGTDGPAPTRPASAGTTSARGLHGRRQ